MINHLKDLSKILIFLMVAALLFIPVKEIYHLYPLYHIKHVGNTYFVDLKQEIKEDIDGYRELRDWLGERTEKETVVFEMSNYGGSVQAGFEIINGIASTKAHTIAWIKGPVYSMGTAISCSTQEIIFSPYSYLMFHRASGGGSESNIKTQEAIMQGNKGCMSKGILPPEEVQKLINNPGYEYYYWPEKGK